MRGMADVSGLRGIRSMRSAVRRSIPRVQRSTYLDLYMLQKAKERLEAEAALLARHNRGIRKRLGEIQKRLGEIRKQMEELERTAQSERPNNGVKKAAEPSGSAKKKWKTFALKY